MELVHVVEWNVVELVDIVELVELFCKGCVEFPTWVTSAREQWNHPLGGYFYF